MAIIKRKHKGKWQYRFCCGYKDAFGVSKKKWSAWYNSSAEAKKEEKRFLANSKTNGIKFMMVANEYIESRADQNTKKTINDKKFFLENLFSDFQYMNIDKITSADIRDLFNNSEYFQKLSTSRKNRARGFLSGIFKYAEAFYDLQRNPMDVIPSFKKTAEERLRKMNIYTPKEFKVFLEAIPKDKEDYKDLFFVLYWTGMRLNEANSLTFNDISPKFINVYRQCINGNWSTLKTDGSQRKIAIDNEIYAIFIRFHTKWSSYPGFDDSWFCFGGYKQLPYTSIERAKDEAIEKAGLPYIRIHDFRHSHASNLIEAGVNIYKISKRLGHSSIRTTIDRYGHLIDEDGHEILNAISKK